MSVFSVDRSCSRGEVRDSSTVEFWCGCVESGCAAYGLGDGWWEPGRDGRYIAFAGSCEEVKDAGELEVGDG